MGNLFSDIPGFQILLSTRILESLHAFIVQESAKDFGELNKNVKPPLSMTWFSGAHIFQSLLWAKVLFSVNQDKRNLIFCLSSGHSTLLKLEDPNRESCLKVKLIKCGLCFWKLKCIQFMPAFVLCCLQIVLLKIFSIVCTWFFGCKAVMCSELEFSLSLVSSSASLPICAAMTWFTSSGYGKGASLIGFKLNVSTASTDRSSLDTEMHMGPGWALWSLSNRRVLLSPFQCFRQQSSEAYLPLASMEVLLLLQMPLPHVVVAETQLLSI